MGKRALITGVTGQDGAYLAEWLLKKGYYVYGGHRRSDATEFWRLRELGILDDVHLVPIEMLEFSNLQRTLERVAPNEIYNLAAQSFVGLSFEQPLYTADVNGHGTMRLLEAVRKYAPSARFYQASTSEMFGKARAPVQNEDTLFHPRSPYGIAKAFAHWTTVNYREAYGVHASSGILFNHESPMRGTEFVTRKVTRGLARVRAGLQDRVELGNLDARRDWGFAGDYVRGMWMMLQQDQGDDYVLSTGESHSVREFVDRAAQCLGMRLDWAGSGVEQAAVDASTGRVVVSVNPDHFRPAEVEALCGDASKARRVLGWTPEVDFDRLVELMVEADLARL